MSSGPRRIQSDRLRKRKKATIPDEPTATTVRRAYEAIDRGDSEGLAAMIAVDATWEVPGLSHVAGLYRGRPAVLGFFEQLGELSQGTMRVILTDVAGTDQGAIVLQQVTAVPGDRNLDASMAVSYRVVSRLLTAARYYVFDLHAYDEFWG